MLKFNTPCNSNLSQCGFELFLNIGFKLFKTIDYLLTVIWSVEELFHELPSWSSKSVALLLRYTIKMLSCQEPTSQWTPSNQSIIILFEQLLIFELNVLSDQHIVLILATDWFVEVMSLTKSECIEYILCVPIACSPIECLALFNKFVE